MTGDEAFSGVGQLLVSQAGGDLPCVVATQANLPIRGSAELAGRFYRQLAEQGDPAAALADARRTAFDRGGRAWSVPVLITRPRERVEPAAVTVEVAGLPARRSTYLDRPEPEEQVLEALRSGRLVSLVGLPGIGKTQVGREAARRALDEGLVRQVIYREAHEGLAAAALRILLATALGMPEPPPDDKSLAAAFDTKGVPVLLLIDNAEDLMWTDAAQASFRAQIDDLLAYSEHLRILLTTRWPVGATEASEREVVVPPMSRQDTSDLMIRELRSLGVLDESWLQSAAWSGLIDLIDGHPRSLWLVSRHFADRRMTLEKVRDRLLTLRDRAIAAPDLLGRHDIFDSLEDRQKDRLRSLVASMDLSFEVLERRHPEAVEAFVALSLFPGGLPEEVALEVTGGLESLALDRLYHYHLIQWHDDRTFYPVPLHWYADRKRKGRLLDEHEYRCRALRGFATFAESCDRLITGGSILPGLDRLLNEQLLIRDLVSSTRGCREPAEEAEKTHTAVERSILARIAAAAHNGLLYVNEVELAGDLARAGLEEAGRLQDRAGEANCLQSLGDLHMRLSDLDAARDAYGQALPIYREIRARLGEANCLQSLGLLYLGSGRPPDAFASFLDVLGRSRDLQDRLIEQAALGYLARTARAAGQPDQALVLSEQSLGIGREIKDRFGQIITLDLQISIWLAAESVAPALAAMIVYRDLARQINDEARSRRYEEVLERVLPSLPVDLRTALDENPDEVRQAAIRRAADLLESRGVDPFAVPASDPC